MKRWMMVCGAAWAVSMVCADGLDREWAEAMLRVRAEFRENGAAKFEAKAKRHVEPSLTGRVFGQMLDEYPYRTDWFLQDNLNDLEAWLGQTDDAVIEKALLKGFRPFGDRFKGLGKPAGGTDDPAWLALYAQAAAMRRTQRLATLKTDYPQIVFTKNHTIMPSFFAYTEGQSDAQAERHFTPGTSLCLMEWEGDFAKVTELVDDPLGRIRDPEVSFDGSKILFAWKKSDRLDDYHLYELDAKTGAIRQLTFGLGVADFEPCYLPNGELVFSSSRCVQTIDCWLTETSNLYTCGPNGEHLRRLGFDQVHTVKPALLPDGRVIYTRWDYNDRGQIYPQGLFQMNPDGTAQTEFYGNNSYFPTTIAHARGIPGSPLVVAVAMGHHTWQAGKLMLLDVSKGRQENAGVQLVAPVRETEAVRQDRYGQQGDLFQYPYPLNEREVLVAYSPLGGRPGRFSIYHMDIDGHRELLVSDPSISCQHPAPLAPRERPAARPSLVDYTQDSGEYYVQDVYYGPGLEGVERGAVKKLRVVEIEFRAAGVGCNYSQGPAGGARASTPVSIANGTWDVKRVLGDATVHPDGSAYFKVPARKPVYFQCLDENNRAVQTMRSWSTLQPGETFSCIGCHEDKNAAPLQRPTSMALKAGAQPLAPFHGETRGFSFLKEVQPILDVKCVACHQKKGKLDLSGTPVPDPEAKRNWTRSYLNLTQAKPGRADAAYRGADAEGLCVWVSSQSVPDMISPRSVGSVASPLIDRLLKGHGKLDREELDKIIAWIDLGVPFGGDYYEAGAWSDAEKAFYDRFQAKRERFAALDDLNVQRLLAGDFSAPTGENRYRNLAPEAKTSANDEKSAELWLKLEWEEDVYADRINISIPADLGKEHDSRRKSGTVELSNGKKITFKLDKTADMQVVRLPAKHWPPQPIRWIKFTNPVPHENKWCGFAEVEVMGRTANPSYENTPLAARATAQ
ncbi:hypothetical protein PDESU_04475 [Pontiella desulfatans]|uniref:Hydrazine synthase alpha subunit middle domain-containing protein n=1 Tax=Pontiella desulfatans TaxID=2750659 RepID=A0A6C2U830_PONDE|nr:hypothetical protein [Pontiella desulfatans]VGO15887.1 hypothetical protein PDESU_04475 [Pontiella desulfatans]